MAAPTLAATQGWTLGSATAAEHGGGASAAVANAAAVEAVSEPLSAPAAVRRGTPATAADLSLIAAIVEASTSDRVVASAAAPVATPAASTAVETAPNPTTATEAPPPAATAAPVATPVATPAAPAVATPVATPAPPPQASTSAPAAAPVPPASYSERAAGLFIAMNEERVAAGMAPLVASDGATAVAMQRALDMQTQGYFAHVSPSGENWLKLVNAAGIPLTAGGENLAKISGDVAHSVEVAITKLMESPTHAANILGVHYERVGVAAVTDARGVTIFVTIFIG